MYEAHWHLDRKPFDDGTDPAMVFTSESLRGAELKLRYAVTNRAVAALLVGEPGLGKTMIVRLLDEQLQSQCDPIVHLVFPKMPAGELLAYLAAELTGEEEAPGGAPRIDETVRRITRCLEARARAGRHTVVAIDEAHLLDAGESLELLRLLLNFEVDGRPPMTLLLVGQPSLATSLDRVPSLEERLAVKCLLTPLTSEETQRYVAHRIRAAGGDQMMFDRSALEMVHRLAHGNPRRINRLCDLALLVGYAEDRRTIEADQIESIAEELMPLSAAA